MRVWKWSVITTWCYAQRGYEIACHLSVCP